MPRIYKINFWVLQNLMSLLIKNRKPIRLRPEIVLTNEEFGHFEVDLIVGTEHKGAILTIV
ncbi:hypothetical protein ACILE2_11785, partial [Capnocytophaga canimorsus]